VHLSSRRDNFLTNKVPKTLGFRDFSHAVCRKFAARQFRIKKENADFTDGFECKICVFNVICDVFGNFGIILLVDFKARRDNLDLWSIQNFPYGAVLIYCTGGVSPHVRGGGSICKE